jgi:hypothetical protein
MRTFVSRETRIVPELSAVSSCPVSILRVVMDIYVLRDCFGVSAHASSICALTYLAQLVDRTQGLRSTNESSISSSHPIAVNVILITPKWNNNTASPRVVVRPLNSDGSMSRVHNDTQLLQHIQTMEFSVLVTAFRNIVYSVWGWCLVSRAVLVGRLSHIHRAKAHARGTSRVIATDLPFLTMERLLDVLVSGLYFEKLHCMIYLLAIHPGRNNVLSMALLGAPCPRCLLLAVRQPCSVIPISGRTYLCRLKR